MPQSLIRAIRRLQKRRSFDFRDFSQRLLEMYRSEDVVVSPFDFDRERERYRHDVAAFQAQLATGVDGSPVEAPSLDLLANAVPQTGSDELLSARDLEAAFLAVLKHLENRDVETATEDLVALMQLRGVSAGNPLVRMAETGAGLSDVWQNGALDGFPFVHLLDALRVNGLITERAAGDAFSRTADHRIIAAEHIYRLLSAGNVDAAIGLFHQFIRLVIDDSTQAQRWSDAFGTVASLFQEHRETGTGGTAVSSLQTEPPVRKAIVSGMGWSGSGAVYAYLSEFSRVVPVPDEFQYISGVVSTRTLRATAGDRDAFRTELLRFFGLSLLGIASYRSYQEYRTLLLSHKYATTDASGTYSAGVLQFCRDIVHSYTAGEFETTLPQAVDTLLRAHPSIPAETGRLPLFDNIVKIYRMDEIDYIPDAVLLCTFRDPRSTYVALSGEKMKFRPNVEAFIKSYRAKRQRAAAAFSRVRNRDRVRIIQFEDFVSSEELRREISRDLGLSPDEQNRYARFQPDVSIRNTDNFRRFEDQEAITRIEQELSEYLWEPHA